MVPTPTSSLQNDLGGTLRAFVGLRNVEHVRGFDIDDLCIAIAVELTEEMIAEGMTPRFRDHRSGTR